jgi:hypothetical protein
MKLITACLLASVALTPFATFAQSSDATYCQALAKLYREVNTGTASGAGAEAINQCNQGNTAAGIPVLEKAITDAKVSLPAR